MKTLADIEQLLREHQDVLATQYGLAVVGMFGSYVRSEQKTASDLDLLAEALKPISLLELVAAENYLGDVLGVKVDLVLKRSVRKELREAILNEAVTL
ncbi:MAG: nucleotidyltransferase family protein [Lentisphaerae bacterium]|nr:nucleotidyltransferase family protein [Lentisphaerota bacterium]